MIIKYIKYIYLVKVHENHVNGVHFLGKGPGGLNATSLKQISV